MKKNFISERFSLGMKEGIIIYQLMYSIGGVWLPSINNSNLHFHKCLKNSHKFIILEPRAKKIECKENCENGPYSLDKKSKAQKIWRMFQGSQHHPHSGIKQGPGH